MPETASRGSSADVFGTAASCTAESATVDSGPFAARLRSQTAGPSARPHRIRGRIGVGLAGGFYPAPHRYQLYLSESCPRSRRVSITLGLLGLEDSLSTTILTLPAETPDAFASLRRAYEATWHHYDGPLTAPALCDRWSGRVVSNHTPDILRDLADLQAEDDGSCLPVLRPPALAAEIDALRDLLDRDVTPAAQPEAQAAALDLLDRHLAPHAYVLGEELTAADVDLWVALTQLDATGAADAPSSYPRLQEYVRRLDGHPAFRRHGKAR